MKALFGFLSFLVVSALLICVVGWIFSTGFFIFDLLLIFVIYALPIFLGILVLIALLWLLNEIFN